MIFHARSLAASAILATAIAAPGLAQAAADDSGSGFRPLLGFQLTTGGDNLAKAEFTDGSSTTIRAGALVNVYGGAEYRFNGAPFAVQGSIGYHFHNASADNGSIRFERFPIELVGLWSPAQEFRLGLGLRYAAGARLVSSGAADIGSFDFKSSIAPLAMAEWLVTPSNGLQLRYVHETFKLNGISFDGSHVGLGYNYYF